MESKLRASKKENIQDILMLSSAQEGMLFHYLKEREDKRYHLCLCVDLEGEVEQECFANAWNQVIMGNDTLRTVFRWEGLENPVQVILKQSSVSIEYYDYSCLDDSEKKERTESIIGNIKREILDLAQIPFKIALIKKNRTSYQMIISFHHIIMDGWSLGIILKEFMDTYEGIYQRRPVVFAKKPRLKDVLLSQKNKNLSLEFWQEYLDGINSNTGILHGKGKQKVHGKIHKYQEELDLNLVKNLKDFAKENQVTFSAVLYVGWALMMQKYNNTKDALFGAVFSGRNPNIVGIENATGMFIETLPLRVNVGKENDVRSLVHKMNQKMMEIDDLPAVPLVDIKDCVKLKGEEQLFNHVVVIENYPLESFLEKEGCIHITSYEMDETTNYDLTVSIMCHTRYTIQFAYDSLLFERADMEWMFMHFIEILKSMIVSPDKHPEEISMMGDAERKLIVDGFNHTEAEYERERLLHQYLEYQAELTPSQTAVICGEKRYTYQQLNEQANQLAWFLKKNHVCQDMIVGIMVERSFEMLVGILGILKAGGAYMPLSCDMPMERCDYIIKDSKVSIILTVKQNASRLQGVNVILLDDESSYAKESLNLNVSLTPKNLAYVIYTSGSTGRPKGVMIEHQAVTNRIYWMQKRYQLKSDDVILQKTTYMFDVSVWELFLWSFAGASVCMLESGGEKQPEKIVEAIEKNKVTVIHFVPSMLNAFLEYVDLVEAAERLQTLRKVFASGEALLPNQVERFYQILERAGGAKLINFYGPTEAAIDVSYYDCTSSNCKRNVPIGKPIDNIQLYIVDENMELNPIGVPGELVISGIGLARGYVNNPVLTQEKFVLRTSYDNKEVCIYYKTGDIAKWLPDGNIEYMGRIDGQVKLRGFRIELGEIESNVLEYEGIKEAAAKVLTDKNDDPYIAVFYTADKELDTDRIKEFLKRKLPEYMIPSIFEHMEYLPLTVNGKLDRKVLQITKEVSGHKNHTFVKPANEVEEQIAKVWSEVLGTDKISTQDNFFDLGGNSLKIIRVSSRLSKELRKKITVSDMFTYPSISKLEEYVSSINPKKEEKENKYKRGNQAFNEKGKKECSVAVIGMAGSFPGARNIEEFWSNLTQGKETITFFDRKELLAQGIPETLLDNINYVKAKGVLPDAEYFDAKFFGYSKAEAKTLDPQLRNLHQFTWEALENAGYSMDLENKKVGVYLGASSNFHWLKNLSQRSKNSLEEFNAFIHNEKDFFSTRIAYKLNLTGPAITMQTACSTSLVSIQTAYEDILAGKCEMAVAGGIGFTYPSQAGYMYYDGMIFSPDGHCKAFSDNAEGTVPGNGVGIVVLKKLKDALEDGDTIYAVIKGTAANNDGTRKVGFTAPSVEGQTEVIRAAMQRAEVKPEQITYVETHGTGTELGDLVEVEALRKALFNTKNHVCKIGSVKTNIGHLDAASGVVGLIKAVLILKNRTIPASLHFENANKRIDFEKSLLEVNTKNVDLSDCKEPIRVGVSSFGMGGTNVHVILEEAPKQTFDEKTRKNKLILLSAKTENALSKMSENLKTHLEKHPDTRISDAAYTLQVGRSYFEYRKAFVCTDNQEAIQYLSEMKKPVFKNHYELKKNHIIFMFSGIGTQYYNMGFELYETEPIYRVKMDECFNIIKDLIGINLKESLYSSDGNLEERRTQIKNDISISHPLLFCFEYSLAHYMMSLGIQPDAMIGYSFGEYVAACVSGVFDLKDALELVLYRANIIKETNTGAMLSIPLTADKVKTFLTDGVWIAIQNGVSCIVSGEAENVIQMEKQMKEKRCTCMWLDTKYAIHSPVMNVVKGRFEEKLKSITLHSPKIPYISGITGTWITVEDATSPSYWVRHLCGTIKFAKGMSQLMERENSIFIEIGPSRNLCVLASNYVGINTQTTLINLIRSENEEVSDQYCLLKAFGRLWVHGVTLDWKKYYTGEKHHRIALPTYPFEKEYFMPDGKINIGGKASNEIVSNYNGERKDIKQWLYVPSWERDEIQHEIEHVSADNKYIILFGNDGNIVEQIKNNLEFSVYQIVWVRKASEKQKKNKTQYAINIEEEKDYEWLFHELEKENIIPDSVLHMWGLDMDLSDDELDVYLHTYYYSLLWCIKNAFIVFPSTSIAFNIITNNMQQVTGEEVLVPEKSLVIGIYNTLSLEYPMMQCKCIDFSVTEWTSLCIQRIAKQITTDIRFSDKDGIVAYRGRYRWNQVFKQHTVKDIKSKSYRIRENGVYLITGGLGGMASVLMEYLTQKTPCIRLVLISRSKFPKEEEWEQWLNAHDNNDTICKKINYFKKLRDNGTKVSIYSADVSNEQEIKEVVADIEKSCGKIHGVIHAAGIADGCMIQLRTKKMSEDVFSAKVRGTKILEKVFATKNLDFLILCSSLASVVSTFGQVAYCAANAFENSFALYWNNKYKPIASSIAWDTWIEVGMAVQSEKLLKEKLGNSDSDSNLYKDGIHSKEGKQIFDWVLNDNQSNYVVSIRSLDYVQNEMRSKGTTVSLDDLVKKDSKQEGYGRRTSKYSSFEIDQGLESAGKIEKVILSILKEYFGEEELGVEDNFFDLGAKSFDLINLSASIEEKINKEVQVVTMFQYPTVRLLSKFITGGNEKEEKIDGEQNRKEQTAKGKRNLNNRLQMKRGDSRNEKK